MKIQVGPHAQLGEGYNNYILNDYYIGLVVCNKNFVKKKKGGFCLNYMHIDIHRVTYRHRYIDIERRERFIRIYIFVCMYVCVDLGC